MKYEWSLVAGDFSSEKLLSQQSVEVYFSLLGRDDPDSVLDTVKISI